jgi:hypothetical protein
MTPPKMCQRCGSRPQAYHGRDLCYDCKPGTRGRPLPCKRCGSRQDYWSEGLCRRCHQYAPQLPDSCRDCLAWPVLRIRDWTCQACTAWRIWYPQTGTCISCRRNLHLNPHLACRLCWMQAKRAHGGDGPVDVVAGNRHGQQLMFANMSSSKNGYRPHPRRPWRKPRPKPVPVLVPQIPGQLDLLEPDPIADAARRHGFGDPPSTMVTDQLDAAVLDHGRRHGWSKDITRSARVGLRVLLAMTGTTAPPVKSSDLDRLISLDLPARPVRTVLADAGLLDEDRPDPVETWFEQHMTGLPASMAAELRIWFGILYRGSTNPPRCRPRHPGTIKTRLRWALPTLQAWAGAGHQSLREITRDQVIAALPPAGTPRVKIGRSLKSIFATLKAQKVIFTNPVSRIRIGNFERRIPLPADTGTLAAALNAGDPATAALAALLVFHGLRPAELLGLKLTDVRDGRCYLPGRTVLLAGPVKTRLAAYLDYRHSRWPGSINPHFFIHYLSAPATGPASYGWVNDRLGLPASAVRQDRIIDEVIAAAGDLRRICDLFGVTIATAEHYTSVLTHPALDGPRSDPTMRHPARTDQAPASSNQP